MGKAIGAASAGGGSVGPGQDGRKAALLEEAGHQKPHMSRYTFRRS